MPILSAENSENRNNSKDEIQTESAYRDRSTEVASFVDYYFAHLRLPPLSAEQLSQLFRWDNRSTLPAKCKVLKDKSRISAEGGTRTRTPYSSTRF